MGYTYSLPANIALCAWNSLPPTDSVTSLNFWFSNNMPRSSDNRHSGTLNCIVLDWPEMFTLSATTLTWKHFKEEPTIRFNVQYIYCVRRSLLHRISLVYRQAGGRWLHRVKNLVWWTFWIPNLCLERIDRLAVIPLLLSLLVSRLISRIWILLWLRFYYRIPTVNIGINNLYFLHPNLLDLPWDTY